MMAPLQRAIGEGRASTTEQAYYLQRLGAAAATSLRRVVRIELSSLFGDFVQRLATGLAEQEAGAVDLRQRHAARELRSQFAVTAEHWAENLLHAVDAHLVGSGAGALPRDSAIDDELAMGHAELRAEDQYRALLDGLDARMQSIRETLYVPIHVRALAPAGLVRALQDTADQLGWPEAQRRLLYRCFEEQVIPQLGALYQGLIATLQAIGSTAEQMAAPAMPPSPQPEPRVDESTLSMLRTCAAQAQDLVYSDHALAADLLALVENRSLPDLPPEQRHAPLQRISMAGQFFSEALADPLVPEDLRRRQDAVRLPLVKTALADVTLFTSPCHPVGSLVDELMLKSATARATGNREAHRAAERIEELLAHFELAPEFVRQALLTQQPVEEAQLQRFLETKRAQAGERRRSVQLAVQRRVIDEMGLCTFGRQVPEPLQDFLRLCWGPLLMKRLLDHGASDGRWSEDLDLLDQLVEQLDGPGPGRGAAGHDPGQELLTRMAERLAAAGMRAERIEQGMARLRSLLGAA